MRTFSIIALLVVSVAQAMSADISFLWDYPVNEITNVASFKIYASTNSGGTAVRSWSVSGNQLKGDATGVTGGKIWYFTIAAVSTTGLESGRSNEVQVDLPGSIPTNFRVSTIVTTSTNQMRVLVESTYSK